jgi:hypothetical protein
VNTDREYSRIVAALEDLRFVWPQNAPVNQFVHSLQVATHLRANGADDQLVVAGLVHDIGKVWHEEHHGLVAAALMEGRLRPSLVDLLRDHSELVGRHREPETDEEQQFIATYSIDAATYRYDGLGSFLPALKAVIAR